MTDEKRLLDYVTSVAVKGNPESVLEAIDQYARYSYFLIHIGRIKRKKLESLIRDVRPKKILELGTNFGYSCMAMAKLLSPGEGKVISIEISDFMARIARQLVAFAGLSDRVQIISGTVVDVIAGLNSPFDMVFLDHDKESYLPDLKQIEKRGLTRKGSLVLADNTGMYRYALGPYLTYVKSSGRYTSQTLEGNRDFDEEIHDAMELSISQMK